MPTNKQQLRSRAKSIIQEKLDLASISSLVNNNIITNKLINSQDNILFYSALDDEININQSLEYYLEKNTNCYLPVIQDNYQLAYTQVYSLQELNNWQVNKYNIKESQDNLQSDFSKIQLALVPALGYTQAKYRLGRGAGYYDRLFAKYTQLITVGIIPSELILDNNIFSLDTWDKPVNYILTENSVFL